MTSAAIITSCACMVMLFHAFLAFSAPPSDCYVPPDLGWAYTNDPSIPIPIPIPKPANR